VVDLGINARHEDDGFVDGGDIFSGVAEGVGSSEFLEANEGGKFFTKVEKEVGLGFEAIVGAVIDDSRKVASGFQDRAKMISLRSGGGATGENTGNDHESLSSDLTGVSGVFGCDFGILGSRSDDDRDSGFDKTTDSFLTLGIRKEGPITHRTAIDNGPHSLGDEILRGGDESVVVDFSLRIAGSHEGGDATLEDGRRGVGHGGENAQNGFARLVWNASVSFFFRQKWRELVPVMPRELNESPNCPLGGDELFDEVPDTTYFIKDAGARYHFVNTTLVGRCGKTRKSDLLGKTAAEVFPSPLGAEFEGQDRRILDGGAAIRSQLELHIYPDGRQGWCLTWKRALRDGEGRIVGLSGISRDVDGAKSSPLDLEALANVLNYIRAHLDGPLRLGELAEATGLSTYQISQRIEGLLGISTKQYITRCRIEAACHLLESSDKSLSEIALSCGFSDQSSFTRQFGKVAGMTPKSYRGQATKI
jgi:PAS domain S-box-containing protein